MPYSVPANPLPTKHHLHPIQVCSRALGAALLPVEQSEGPSAAVTSLPHLPHSPQPLGTPGTLCDSTFLGRSDTVDNKCCLLVK